MQLASLLQRAAGAGPAGGAQLGPQKKIRAGAARVSGIEGTLEHNAEILDRPYLNLLQFSRLNCRASTPPHRYWAQQSARRDSIAAESVRVAGGRLLAGRLGASSGRGVAARACARRVRFRGRPMPTVYRDSRTVGASHARGSGDAAGRA